MLVPRMPSRQIMNLRAFFSIAICVGLGSSCGKSEKEPVTQERVVEKTDYDYTSFHPPLTPELSETAAAFFKQSYDAAIAAPADTNKYTQPKDVCDQNESSLCFGFSLRDLLVNNLGLDEEQKPSIFSLLRLNTYDSSKILFHPDMAYNFEHFDFIKVASQGAFLSTEKSEPFEMKLAENYESFIEGKGLVGTHTVFPAIKPKLIPILLNGTKYQSALVEIPPSDPLKIEDKVRIPKFRINDTNINTTNLVKEMATLARRLAVGKAQVMGVCGKYIRGFSKKLVPESSPNARYRNTHNGASVDCGFHAVLVNDVRISDKGEYFIRFKNSWGTEYSDDGFHELEVEDFISILNLRLETESDARVASYRLEFDRVDQDEIPTHKLAIGFNWQLYAKTKDNQNFLGDVRLVNIFTNDEITCPLQEAKDKKCNGTATWNSKGDPRRMYVYKGEIVIPALTPSHFKQYFYEGKGKVTLWGNTIKEGLFSKDSLKEGSYYEFFAAGRSSQISLKETGTFNDKEELIKGKRISYDRAGNVLSEKTL